MAPRRSYNTVRVASAAHRLPPELLLECLRAADPPTRVRASHVSRRWRAIALSDRRLWDRFSCSHFRSVQHQDTMFNKLQAMLIRSRSLPFRLRIPHQYYGTFVKYWLRLLGLEQMDVRRLALYDGPWEVLSSLMHGQTPLPTLASLNITEPDDAGIYLEGTLSGSSFPNLRALEAPFVRFSSHSRPFPAVQHLTYSLEDGLHLERLFQVFPNVVHLHINAIAPFISLPPASSSASLHTVALSPLPGCDLDVGLTLQNLEAVRLPRLVAHKAGSVRGVLELFLAMHPHPVELRLNGGNGEIVLTVPADEFTWAITPSEKCLLSFLQTLEMDTCERLTSISVALEQLDRLFAARLHIPGLQRLELQLGGSQELPQLRVGDEGYYMSAPRLQRLAFSIDGQADASHARIDKIQSFISTLAAAFRSLIAYDADLLDSAELSAPAAYAQKLNLADFARLAKACSVCASA